MNKMPKGDRETAIRLLSDSTLTLKEISNSTGVPTGTLGHLSKKHRLHLQYNYPKHVPAPKRPSTFGFRGAAAIMTEEWIQEHLIEKGMTLQEMANAVGVSRERVRQIIKQRGFHSSQRRPNADLSYWRKTDLKGDLDNHYFDVIDTEEKAYWLGYISAKGRVTNVNHYGRKALEINSTEPNKPHVDRFRAAIGLDREMHETWNKVYKKRYYNLHVPSQHMACRLQELNVKQPKHEMTRVPADVPPELLHHYFRGHFDGKGFILQMKRNKRINIFFMYGSDLLLYDFCVYLSETIGVDLPAGAVVSQNDGHHLHMLFKISAKKKILKIMQALYKDATIYMERNLEKYTSAIEED